MLPTCEAIYSTTMEGYAEQEADGEGEGGRRCCGKVCLTRAPARGKRKRNDLVSDGRCICKSVKQTCSRRSRRGKCERAARRPERAGVGRRGSRLSGTTTLLIWTAKSPVLPTARCGQGRVVCLCRQDDVLGGLLANSGEFASVPGSLVYVFPQLIVSSRSSSRTIPVLSGRGAFARPCVGVDRQPTAGTGPPLNHIFRPWKRE